MFINFSLFSEPPYYDYDYFSLHGINSEKCSRGSVLGMADHILQGTEEL